MLFKVRWDQRKRETVLDYDVIQGTVINTWTETTVLLSNEEERMKPFECFINVVLHCLIFQVR